MLRARIVLTALLLFCAQACKDKESAPPASTPGTASTNAPGQSGPEQGQKTDQQTGQPAAGAAGDAAAANTAGQPRTGDAGTPGATGSASARPLYFDRPITPADLQGRTLRELALMRNTIFARAGQPFRKQWLRDYFTAQPWYKPGAEMDRSKLTDTDWANSRAIATYETSLSEKDLEARVDALRNSPDAGKPGSDVAIELALLSARVGQWVGSEELRDASSSPLEDPARLDKLLTVEQLSNLSRRDLRLLRNTIYARRGYEFKSPILTDYFETMDWYEADPEYTDARLTAVDWKNIKMVRSVEDSLGGPLSDEEHGEEIGWFLGA